MIESYAVNGRRVAEGAFDVSSETFMFVSEGRGCPEIKDYLLELRIRHRNGLTHVVLDVMPYTQSAERAFLHVRWQTLLGSKDTYVHASPGYAMQSQQVVSTIAMHVRTLDEMLEWRKALIGSIGHALFEHLILEIADCVSF